jgi:hypothetical protein
MLYTVSRLLGHADVRITQEVHAPLSGRFLAEQAAGPGRHIGPSLVRELPALPSLRQAIRTPGIPSGANRDRTGDLLNAIQALSQLSYSPGPFAGCPWEGCRTGAGS